MSLASLLLKGDNEKVDNELDTLFLSQPVQPPLQPTPAQILPKVTASHREDAVDDTLKRKRAEPSAKNLPPSSAKRQKPDAPGLPKSPKNSDKAPAKHISKARKEKKRLLARGSNGESDSEAEENDPALEDRYLRRTSALKKVPGPQSDSPSEEDTNANSDAWSDDSDDEKNDGSESEDEDYDINAPPPRHETETRTRKKKTKKVKYVLPDETPAQRDARTVFIGNVSIDIVKSRPAQKQLKRYILQLVPQAKIESIRFRSIAFSAPTSSLKEENKPEISTKEKRQMERAETWRNTEEETKKGAGGKRKKDGDSSDNDQQQKSTQPTLTPAQRKRVAFYKQEFHNEVDSANAYVVFAHIPEDAGNDSSGLHPAEAARLLVEKGNGVVFMSRTLRMDRVGQWRGGLPESEKNHINLETLVDPHCTLFVGNLDFASKEEDLRTFFDTLVSKERNEPENKSISEDDDEASAPEKKSWVKSVRVIRDKETQMGKGFAYVRFIDRDCVDEILALEPGSVKFAKRKLRLQKCKGLPGATPKSMPVVKPSKDKSSQAKTKTKSTSVKTKSPKVQHTPVVIPKGDPNLGAKLASLSKEERKAVKAADSARLERRLAKKQAKSQTKGKTGAEKLDDKQRHRQRKGSTAGKKAQSGSGGKKTRLRSEKSLAKRNMKK